MTQMICIKTSIILIQEKNETFDKKLDRKMETKNA